MIFRGGHRYLVFAPVVVFERAGVGVAHGRPRNMKLRGELVLLLLWQLVAYVACAATVSHTLMLAQTRKRMNLAKL